MSDSGGCSAGVQKVLDKLKSSLDAGNHYEAQQMLKTVYYRYRARKQPSEAYQLLEEGARLQLKRGQFNCGLELALLLAEAYSTDKLPVEEAALQRLTAILDAFPSPAAEAESSVEAEGATRFVGAALKWCRGCGGQRVDAATLHDCLAAYLWEALGMQGLAPVTAHYARGSDRFAFAAVLVEAAAKGAPEEEDLFLARALLQTLAVGPGGRGPEAAAARRDRVTGAAELLDAYQSLACRSLPDTPLVHFLRLLLKALDEFASLPLLRLLRREYGPVLRRDSSFSPMLDRLEEVWFGVQQQSGLGGVLGDLMQMLAAPS